MSCCEFPWTKHLYDQAGELSIIQMAAGTPLKQSYATYTYSGDGLKLSETDARNNSISTAYDGFNRVAKVSYNDGSASPPNEQFAYDANGDVTIWTNRDGLSVIRCYDVLGRKVAEKGYTGAGNIRAGAGTGRR